MLYWLFKDISDMKLSWRLVFTLGLIIFIGVWSLTQFAGAQVEKAVERSDQNTESRLKQMVPYDVWSQRMTERYDQEEKFHTDISNRLIRLETVIENLQETVKEKLNVGR